MGGCLPAADACAAATFPDPTGDVEPRIRCATERSAGLFSGHRRIGVGPLDQVRRFGPRYMGRLEQIGVAIHARSSYDAPTAGRAVQPVAGQSGRGIVGRIRTAVGEWLLGLVRVGLIAMVSRQPELAERPVLRGLRRQLAAAQLARPLAVQDAASQRY